MNTRLNLYVYVDGINDIPFYGDEYLDFILVNGDVLCTSSGDIFSVKSLNEQITVGSFKYSAQRMGSAPSITFTLRYPSSLDGLWNENIYAIFNGKKYFLKQTPSSSIVNSEEGYSYEVELIDERVILDNTYFFDATENPNEEDKPVSNGTKFNFFGDVHDFADRLNKSLLYSGIQKKDDKGVTRGYRIVVDEGISSEEKLISFDNKFFSEALKDVYNTFQIPYYFVGEVIHFGHNDTPISEVFKYGIDNSLLSIKMDNANSKVVNRATAIGSSDNIPYYYPNNSPKGTIRAVASDGHTITMLDTELYANSIAVGGTISFHKNGAFTYSTPKTSSDSKNYYPYDGSEIPIVLVNMKPMDIWFKIEIRVIANGVFNLHCVPTIDGSSASTLTDLQSAYLKGDSGNKYLEYGGNDINLGYLTIGTYELYLAFSFGYKGRSYSVKFNFSTIYLPFYINDENGEVIQLKDVGLRYEGGDDLGNPNSNMVITQELVRYVKFADNLMPPKYRNTDGKERFYNATNDTYVDEEGQPIVFVNPYTEGHPKEDIFEVEDIKPTIKEVKNALNQRIDMFSDIAYDENDSDEVYTDKDGNTVYKHPHFFAKLRKLPFNLFEHAIEGAEMTISITSGDCGACSFRVKVDSEYPYSNPVQVDNNGNLKYDENGMVLCGLEDVQPKVVPQDIQQDTINNEVWIALEKEEDTYGILMPKSPVYDGQTLIEKGYRVKACSDNATDDGDTFVILNISLPDEYILAAEEKLEKEIVKYLKENNSEKFKFTINFSRIFFAENPSILEQLDENSCIQVEYNDVVHTLYVSAFNYDMSDGESLPNISVDLSDSITVSQSALQTAISQVERRVIATVSNIDIANIVGQTFLRKDIEDTVNGKINFRKGVKFGEGASVDIDENNNTKLSVDYLHVNKKATFTSLEIQEKTHVSGQIIISPASMVCSRVEELEDSYKCFFETTSQNGSDIMNLFVVGDQAICQTFNEWSNKYYWRLVTEVGKNYISLSKSDCDLNSDIPSSGDKIIQFGNRDDNTRQSAIILSSNGDNSPSIILYNSINSFSLESKDITSIEWNKEKGEPQLYSYGSFYFGDRNKVNNFVKFSQEDGDTQRKLRINADVEIGSGSSGLENLSEWAGKQSQIDNAKNTADSALSAAEAANEYTDQVKNDTLDLMAQKIGYADYADMLGKISNGKTIISGGMLNTSIIIAKAIKASMIDIENLFAQHIEANDLLLKDGCSIGDSVNIEGGQIVSKQTFDGLEYRTHIAGGRIFTQIPDKNDTTKSIKVEVGGCSGSGIMAFGPDSGVYCSLINDGDKKLSCGVLSDFSDGLSFYSPNGQMGGIRPYVFIANSSLMEIGSDIPYWANTIIAKYYPAMQTIYLPDTPQKGDWYRIINDYRRGSMTLRINGNGKSIETSTGIWTVYDLTSRAVLEFVYDGTEWHII